MAERTVVHDTIVTERTYGRPPDRVFAAWREPATKREWFAEGEGCSVTFRRSGFVRQVTKHVNHERMAEVGPSPDAPPDFEAPNDLLVALDVRQGHVCRHCSFSLAGNLFAGQNRDVSEVENSIGSPFPVPPHFARG